jgi:hypothetical protein
LGEAQPAGELHQEAARLRTEPETGRKFGCCHDPNVAHYALSINFNPDGSAAESVKRGSLSGGDYRRRLSKSDDNYWHYQGPALITGVLSFLALWAYAVDTYGWFLGGGLGWIPALFLAVLLGLLWPLLLLGLIIVLVGLAPQLSFLPERREWGEDLLGLSVLAGLLGLFWGMLWLLHRARVGPRKK